MDEGSKESEHLRGVVRVAQIIILALAGGVCAFGAFALFAMKGPQEEGEAAKFIPLAMAAFAAALVVARIVVPMVVVSQARRGIASGKWPARPQPGAQVPETDSGRLAVLFMNKTLIGSAILEAAAFANVFAFWTDGEWYNFGIAVAMLAGILIAFPTHSGVSSWIDRQTRLVREERNLRGLRGAK